MEGETDGEVWLVSSSGLTEVVVAGVEMTEVTEDSGLVGEMAGEFWGAEERTGRPRLPLLLLRSREKMRKMEGRATVLLVPPNHS
ncbi:hypothetical protein E2C01_014269 [Portunus trituberculatus]|uniref:Uncharacterized protein n=1 Tax=Portunus trituberculatus TaxID=210409 RepID=A0A5B7DJC6_PORTR|nr:hypothetical protein [Portunus trituberculatus]